MVKQWRNEDIITPADAQRWEDGVEQSIKNNDQNAGDLKKHAEDKNNPHGVTAAQAGAYTKVETDSRDAAILQTAKAHTDTHESRKNNPHGVTAAQTGAYTKAESNANDQEILTTAKQYTDEKKAEATTFTSQEVAKVKTEIQNGNVASATKLQASRKIAGVDFDGTKDIAIPAGNVGAYTKAEADTKVATAKSEVIGGNVASATKLQTARTINGVAFDGTRNVELLADPQVSEIPANANLNNYKNAGFYGCRLSATAETVSNTPTTVAFSLVVLNAGNESIVTQLLSEFNTPAGSKLYIRRCYNNSWGGWHPIATADGTLQSGLFAQSASRLAAARTISLTGGVTGSTTFDGSGNASIAATVAGNAPSASRLATPRTISLTGGATGSVSFDGSNNVSLATTLSGNAPTATRLATPRTISLTGGVTGSTNFDGSGNASIAATVDVIDIQHATGSNITVVPRWDCTAEINVQLAGWGFGGGKWTVGINTPSGTNQVVSGAGVIDGSDNIFRHISYASIFTGLKQGQSYRFERTTLEGQIGRADNGLIIAKLYRIG
ncbi:hypothetical protein P0G38_06970 [Enterococcus casseliflavus]|uniref:pyocin knob domain-containing protein n=1 Tax=Enterococcus casseliflavus TaxID=37734 RepID=UPI0023DBDA20|nr:hypothetical protein [Enterococcus casseliflavus]WEL48795.1 hypothetical protein P0G38_06970 [Enterococcus casseliflavus]